MRQERSEAPALAEMKESMPVSTELLLTICFGLALGTIAGIAIRSKFGTGRSALILCGVLVVLCAMALGARLVDRVNAEVHAFTPGSAAVQCAAIATDFQRASSRWAVASWLLSTVAAFVAVLGGILGQGSENETRWHRRSAGVLLATTGTVLASTSAFAVARSNAASASAAAATRALLEKDPHAIYQKCLASKADWLQSRTDAMDQIPPPLPRNASPVASGEGEGNGTP